MILRPGARPGMKEIMSSEESGLRKKVSRINYENFLAVS